MSYRKKILLITSGFPFGDVERGFISAEFETLRKYFDLHLISVGSKEELIHPFPEDIPVERYFHRFSWRSLKSIVNFILNIFRPLTIAEIFRSITLLSPRKTLMRVKQILFYSLKAHNAAKHIEKIIYEENIDIIYTYWCTEMTLAAAILKNRYPGIKLVTRFHGHDLFTERRPENWQPFRTYISKKTDKLVFACKNAFDYYISHWGKYALSTPEIHYLGCKSAEKLKFSPDKQFKLLSCSNLIPLKRVDLIIDAISKLPDEHSVRWDHFGDGTERKSLEEYASTKLGRNVEYHFHGRVPNNTLEKCYREINPDLFITTSSTEGGAPVSIQEAFSMGIPAIGTDVGGIPDLIIHEKTGYLLNNSPTKEDICNSIESYIKLSDSQKEQMSNNAYALWKEKFDAHNNAEHFSNMLLHLERTK